MASRNVGCFLGLRKLMKANTEQLACWRRSDSRARRSDGRGELHCTPGKRGGGGGGGGEEGRMRERLLSERLEKATKQH